MTARLTVLRGGGACLVLAQARAEALPVILHWGEDLPDAAVSGSGQCEHTPSRRTTR